MIDWHRVDALRDEIGEDDFADVAALFLQECDETLGQVAAAGTVGADVLHFLKGAALNLGFAALADRCAQDEAACRAGQPVPAEPVLAIYRETRAAFVRRVGQPA